MEFDDVSISDDEVVLRRIAEDFVTDDQNLQRLRPSTQAFKQDGPDGLVSVYLISETEPATVADEGPEKYLASTSIRVGVLRELGLGVVRDPSSGGLGHCVITGRKPKGRLNQIVRKAEWVNGYAPE